MKKKLMVLVICLGLFQFSANAQVLEIISIIKAAVTKAIKAVDLEVQRMQTETVWLQDAQKQLENTMSALQLDDIRDWVQKQKDLYQEYYTELAKVKAIIADYEKVKKIVRTQAAIASKCRDAYNLFQQDKNFSPDEIAYIYQVYSGILTQSLENLNQGLLVVNAFVTQMSDQKRIEIINQAEKAVSKNYNDLSQFTSQNIQLSLQRAASLSDVQTIKNLYGLP